jgi:hypothetical protein
VQTMDWLWSHIGSMEKAVALVNEFCWSISMMEENGVWYVRMKENILFSADSREAVDAFLYGMALSLSGIPEPILTHLRQDVKDWCEHH